MFRLEAIESINDPGQPGSSGDDRFGFDLGAGTAWVLDGATDVTDLAPFPRAESGAAWFAEALSARLMTAPGRGQSAADYFRHALQDVRARSIRETDLPLDSLPREASPIAAGIWLRATSDAANTLELCWLGDCMAIVAGDDAPARLIGTPEKAESETEVARELLQLSEADRMEALRAARRFENRKGRAIFGLIPDAAEFLERECIELDSPGDILLMSDGFFRLVSPYGAVTADELVAQVRKDGLLAALRELRSFEGPESDNAKLGRLKRRDDACALWLRWA